MEKDIRIGQIEYFTLFVILRLFGFITFNGDGSTPINSPASLITQPLAALLAFGAFVIITKCVNRAEAESPIQLCYKPGKIFGIISAVIMCIASFMALVQVCHSFTKFFTMSAYPRASAIYFVLFLLAGAIYIEHMGIDSLSRLSNVLFFMLGFSVLILIMGLWRNIDALELITPLYDGTNAFMNSLVRAFADWGDILLMLGLLRYVSADGGKPAGYVFIIITVIAELLSFLLITVYGDYGKIHLFPVHSLFAAAEIWIPTRVDFLFMFLFLSACLVRATLYLTYMTYLIKTILPPERGKYASTVVAIAAGAVSLWLCGDRADTAGFMWIISSGIPLLIAAIVPTVIAYLYVAFGGRKRV